MATTIREIATRRSRNAAPVVRRPGHEIAEAEGIPQSPLCPIASGRGFDHGSDPDRKGRTLDRAVVACHTRLAYTLRPNAGCHRQSQAGGNSRQAIDCRAGETACDDMGTARTSRKTAAGASGREAILDAAEQTFGSQGFDGGSMSQIAQLAGVAQSLLHYHYKTKDHLYEAVFERRAAQIQGQRQARLEALFRGAGKVRIEEVLEILFISLEDLLGLGEFELRHYVHMVADVTMSSSQRSIKIVKRCYDPSAELFIEAIRKVYPELSIDEAVWCYLFAIGGRMQAHAGVDRAVRLGATRANGRKQYGMLVRYAAAGIKAIAKARQGDA